MRRFAALLVCLSLGILAGPVCSATSASATARSGLAPFPAKTVDFVGYGDGPGLGMGQWGAFGYAVLDHKRYQWILAHYYGGTVLSSGDSLVSGNPMVSVDINENDGHPLVVTSPSAFSFGGQLIPAGRAVRAVLAAGLWTLSEAPSCMSKKWAPIASQLMNPVAVPFSQQSSATSSQVLTICEHGGRDIAVRGTVQAYDAPNGAVTLNVLPLEEYVLDVVSAEVSWSWGIFGGLAGAPQSEPWGFQALEAQAVATRSYVAAEIAAGGWQTYATTCDSYCQSYPGMADETPVMDAAVEDTAGEILEQPAQSPSAATPTPGQGLRSGRTVLAGQSGQLSGVPVLAQYSASTGGRTVGGPFPGVVDRGDSVCIKSSYYTCNPCHHWTSAVPVRSVEKEFKALGKLAALKVTERNGVGALGGRVESVAVVGVTGAQVTVPAYELGPLIAANNPYHCASDWYAVTNGP